MFGMNSGSCLKNESASIMCAMRISIEMAALSVLFSIETAAISIEIHSVYRVGEGSRREEIAQDFAGITVLELTA